MTPRLDSYNFHWHCFSTASLSHCAPAGDAMPLEACAAPLASVAAGAPGAFEGVLLVAFAPGATEDGVEGRSWGTRNTLIAFWYLPARAATEDGVEGKLWGTRNTLITSWYLLACAQCTCGKPLLGSHAD
eukprot:1140158-Pelagomonas_calceolata.AAC.1